LDEWGDRGDPEMTYVFSWGNNPKRKELKGRRCVVLAAGAKNSRLIEFENGQKEIVSRRALREAPPEQPRLFP